MQNLQNVSRNVEQHNKQYGDISITDYASVVVGDVHIHNDALLDPERKYHMWLRLAFQRMITEGSW